MRPLRLDLEGFTAFREPVTLDFEGADLFALSGPTGAGKSSVLDAICFALYGTVPRLDRRAVAPVVASGLSEARVRLAFTVGKRAYVAARVVRRQQGGGATTKEARLESGDVTLAGDADGVSRKVEELLGLGFDQFTTCVILPQGEFARFLHDRPAERQALLVRLLELEVYSRMRELANVRRAAAGAAQEAAERELANLADATPDGIAAADEEIARLDALRGELEAAQPRLDALAAQAREAERVAAEELAGAERLDAVRIPPQVAALTERAIQAEQAAAAAERGLAEAERAVSAAEARRAALGDPGPLERARDDAAERSALVARLERGQPIVAETRREEHEAEERVAAARAAADDAAEALEAARRQHAAAHLAASVGPGDPCPVCARPLEAAPDPAAGADLAVAERALARSHDELAEETAALRDASLRRARGEEQLAALGGQLAALDARLAGAPEPQEAERLLGLIAQGDVDLAAARAAERTARAGQRAAVQAVTAEQRLARDAWSDFDAARDAVAALGPPPVAREDLQGSWTALAGWAEVQAPALRERAEESALEAQAAEGAAKTLRDELADRCRAAGVVTDGERLRDACTDALASARASRERLAADLERAGRLRQDAQAAVTGGSVARRLARHLAANGFERWLLDEALSRLAVGASTVLRELSAGQYSLAVDAQRHFLVVDHRSADERRPARTLSGGETFLASLALALTLAEHLAALATTSHVRLESIFLDEGFGALDPETLDVVAAALEELGSRGRMVGLVTHVRDLAERLPLRFDVRRGPSGSTVQRVLA